MACGYFVMTFPKNTLRIANYGTFVLRECLLKEQTLIWLFVLLASNTSLDVTLSMVGGVLSWMFSCLVFPLLETA